MEKHTHKEPEWHEHEGTDGVVCPHCGYDNGNDDMGNEGTLWCAECGVEFTYEAEYSVTYSTRKVEAPRPDPVTTLK
jgi:transcription elongation factor Elf1